jgi:photosystem II stability/assembly factor-like uncharacterized protein
VAPKILPPTLAYAGAIHFRDGIIWAGDASIVYSEDSGQTWNTTSYAPQIFTPGILDISFCNRDTGVVNGDDIWQTQDRGKTWIQVTDSINPQRLACEHNTTIIRGIGLDGNLFTSSDGGSSWNNGITIAEETSSALTYGIDSSIYAIGIDTPYPYVRTGYVVSSTDDGTSWKRTPDLFDGDSWTIDVDSCDNQRLYIANENYFAFGDGLSKIYVSSDLGMNWTATFTSTRNKYLSGAMACSSHAVFATPDAYYVKYGGLIPGGVLRSTDHGLTWKDIGGPGTEPDTRTICAINDNIIFVLDADGNIWATFNSGGDSILESSFQATLSASPSSLFVADTIACDSLTRSVVFSRTGCTPPSVSSFSVIDSDSASFIASNLSFDSIQVTLYGTRQGNQNAKLVLNLDNGSSDTVTLAGYVNIIPENLSFSTQNVQTDTLGTTVAVPITLNGLERAENVTLVMHYDGSVDYLGSFSPTGVQLDIPGEQWAGRSELAITGATSGEVMGYAKFNVFNDSNTAAHATFDSVNVLTQTSACEYAMPAPDTSTITTLSGCAIPILSQLIHLGVEPALSIVPNPANGNVWISSSSDLGTVTIEIYDMLGVQQSVVSGQISENNPMELLLPARSGVYNILVHSIVGTRTLRVVREN